MRRFIKYCLTWLISICVTASAVYGGARDQDILNALAASVVFLSNDVLMDIPGSGRHIKNTTSGTGFLVSKNESEFFLVTAAHVASSMNQNARVTVRSNILDSDSVPITELSGQAGPPHWIMNPIADVACLRLSLSTKDISRIKEYFLPLSALESAEPLPSRDIELLVLGFPLALGAGGSFSPISRKSFVASGLVEYSFPGDKSTGIYFLLQDPGMSGFSGAPVFDLSKAAPNGSNGNSVKALNGIKVVGLEKGTISDNTGGKLSAVVPARLILETLILAK